MSQRKQNGSGRCPICGKVSQGDSAFCQTCNKDISLWREMSNTPYGLAEAGHWALESGDHQTAITNLLAALDFQPDDPHLLRQLAEAYRRSGAVALETETLERLLAASPGDGEARARLMRLLAS